MDIIEPEQYGYQGGLTFENDDMTYKTSELKIKNMICSRCFRVIREDIESLGAQVLDMEMGRIKIRYPGDKITIDDISQVLRRDEFEIINDRDKIMTERIKSVLVDLINDVPVRVKQKLSATLAGTLHRDYWTLSKTFSKTEGITVERYFILLRVEKAKELIEYEELNFSEIAYDLGYNNLNHLSRQFKLTTGMSMTEFKKLRHKPRVPLDKIL